jgi:hypothetical protein
MILKCIIFVLHKIVPQPSRFQKFNLDNLFKNLYEVPVTIYGYVLMWEGKNLG